MCRSPNMTVDKPPLGPLVDPFSWHLQAVNADSTAHYRSLRRPLRCCRYCALLNPCFHKASTTHLPPKTPQVIPWRPIVAIAGNERSRQTPGMTSKASAPTTAFHVGIKQTACQIMASASVGSAVT